LEIGIVKLKQETAQRAMAWYGAVSEMMAS
jgi:hypothetical protein